MRPSQNRVVVDSTLLYSILVCFLLPNPARWAGLELDRTASAPYDPNMASIIDKSKRARQLARAISSDLTLYHEAKILEGISEDTLFEVMADEITEGRELFKSRVTPELFADGIFDRAIVDVLVKSKGHVKSKIW